MWPQFMQSIDPLGILQAGFKVQMAWLSNLDRLLENHNQFLTEAADILPQAYQRWEGDCNAAHPSKDERFANEAWSKHWYWDALKEGYLLSSHWIKNRILESSELGVDAHSVQKAAFWAEQVLNACSPSNHWMTNPQAIEKAQATQGKSLMEGACLWLEDCCNQTIKMVDEKPFVVGQNLATTAGAVVYRNELMELIHYSPQTPQVHAIPVLIVPPWINKYYILDLNPHKSLIHFLVQEGFSVFTISWKNPGAHERDLEFEDYLFKGIQTASQVIQQILGTTNIHALGYCVGGTALASFLAWSNQNQQHKKENPIAHATFLCTLVDFTDPGEIGVFIDETTVALIHDLMTTKGFLDGHVMANTFRLLRSNSLIWQYVVQRYLLGEEPPAFDVLYWNMDTTRLSEKMHDFYLKSFYLHNQLSRKGQLKIKEAALDLGKITQSIYAVGTQQDHITPWKGTFKICNQIKGSARYVLASSGHIVGILSPPINPPKRRYWVADATGAHNPDHWQEQATLTEGSWWNDWKQWLSQHCGPMVSAPTIGSHPSFPSLCKAPGLYVLER